MRKLAVLCCLLVVLAGCPAEGSRSVGVSIQDPTVETRDSRVMFHGELRVREEPMVGEFEMKDVRIVFENDAEVVETVDVGTVSHMGLRQNISASLREPPDRVRIETGEVRIDEGEIGPDDTVVLYGLQRNGTGGYEYFEQSSQ